MKPFVLVVFTTLLISACNSKRILSEKEFTSIFRDSLVAASPANEFRIKKDLFITAMRDSNEIQIYLDNAYTTYKQDPDSIADVIATYRKSSMEFLNNFEQKPIRINRIVPVIKDAAYIDEVYLSVLKNDAKAKKPEYVFDQYNEKLIILYGEDRENGISYILKEDFEKTGIKRDSLLPIALRNLDTILPKIQRQGDNGLFMLTAGGTYEASIILMKSIWTKEQMPVKGKIVIAVPSRDLLLVTGSENKEGIKKIKDLASETVKNGSYYLIDDLFVWNGEKFEVFKE
jgi:uncharacterized protein YtpQ (UPF0354 family)